jgi:ubiquinone/menaquinone biosynthesis C-methylase UbiE
MDTRVRDAYDARAGEYIAALGSRDAVHPDDRALVSLWAKGVNGRLLDAGCGPGHWTSFIHHAKDGVGVEGVDMVPAFVVSASERFPDVPFRIGSLDALEVADASLAGLLSWYSIIHTPPETIPAILREFARCLSPGGTLLLAFFDGATIEPFDHAVVMAYRWPVAAITRELHRAEFDVVKEHTRNGIGHRPHAALVAQRRVADTRPLEHR